MRNVLYTCPFVPAEWIAAHGLEPMRIAPEPTREGLPAGMCPFAAAFIHAAVAAPVAAVIATTVCDQMRRGAEIIESRCGTPVFLMNVPATAAMGLYRDELDRLGRFLAAVGGAEPSGSQLAETMLNYESLRAAARDSRRESGPGVRLALGGGPLRSTDREIFKLIEQVGGTVVLDATAGGEMTEPAPFDRARMAADPAGELANAYFGAIPHAMRRPNRKLYEYLNRELIARGVRGLIYRRYQWCDTWHGEAGRLKDSLPTPVLDLVAGDDESDRAYVLTRIQAFVEMLK